MEKNTFRIDTSGSAELRDYFARKKEGSECQLTISMVVTELTSDGVTGKIKEIELPGDEEYEDKSISPTGESPVSVTVTGTAATVPYEESLPR